MDLGKVAAAMGSEKAVRDSLKVLARTGSGSGYHCQGLDSGMGQPAMGSVKW